MGWVPYGGPSWLGLSSPGLATLGGSHPSAAGSSVLLGVHGVQLASSASTYGSYQGLVLSSSLSLTLFLGCLPLRWLMVLVLGGCCGQLLGPLTIGHRCCVMPFFPICLSSIFPPQLLVGLTGCCFPATESTPWLVQWRTACLFSWPLPPWCISSTGWPELLVVVWQFRMPLVWRLSCTSWMPLYQCLDLDGILLK